MKQNPDPSAEPASSSQEVLPFSCPGTPPGKQSRDTQRGGGGTQPFHRHDDPSLHVRPAGGGAPGLEPVVGKRRAAGETAK